MQARQGFHSSASFQPLRLLFVPCGSWKVSLEDGQNRGPFTGQEEVEHSGRGRSWKRPWFLGFGREDESWVGPATLTTLPSLCDPEIESIRVDCGTFGDFIHLRLWPSSIFHPGTAVGAAVTGTLFPQWLLGHQVLPSLGFREPEPTFIFLRLCGHLTKHCSLNGSHPCAAREGCRVDAGRES